MRKLLSTINQKVQLVTSFIFLHLVYFLGLGPTSLLAKLAGKRFLEMKARKSNWKKYSGSEEWERMY